MSIHDDYDNLESSEDFEAREKELAKYSEQMYNRIMVDFELAARNYHGRVLIREILKDCGLYNVVTPDNESSIHADGRRYVGQLLKTRLDKIDPKLYHEIMLEGVDYEKILFK